VLKITSTIKDVARHTGLSIATISKYINGGNVLEENRVKIQEAIDKLGFKVNTMARGLKTNKTMTIGILIPSFVNVFCMNIVSHIENILIKQGYSAIICDYKEDFKVEQLKLQFLIDKLVDGLIIMPSGYDEDIIREAIKRKIPVVQIDRALNQLLCDAILVDNMSASYNAVECLITRGHKRIGIITGPEDVYTGAERLKGYTRVHEDYSMVIDKELIKYGDFKIESGHIFLKELMDMTNPPTAIFITNYEMTVGAIMAINERNIEIPREVSIIGFDSFELSRVVKPELSMVIQPLKEIGETAAEVLLNRINGDFANFPIMHRLKTEILITESIAQVN
jgi:LacI family transcriptional regulator